MRTKMMCLTRYGSAFWPACGRREEDPLSAMWRAYLDGKSKAQSEQKSSSGVGQHIYIGLICGRCHKFELPQNETSQTRTWRGLPQLQAPRQSSLFEFAS